jgi:hypothetical protein
MGGTFPFFAGPMGIRESADSLLGVLILLILFGTGTGTGTARDIIESLCVRPPSDKWP